MTIATRNRFIRLSTALAFGLSVAAVAAIALILIRHGVAREIPGPRQITLPLNGPLSAWSAIASLFGIAVFPFLALAGFGYVLFAFEKTQSAEITFFAVALLSLSLEACRLMIPFYHLGGGSGALSVGVSQVVVFSRTLAALSLLASGIFATTPNQQQIGQTIFLITFFSVAIASAIPINSANVTSNFLIQPGYAATVNVFYVVIGALSVLSYLITGQQRGTPEFTESAGGLVLMILGYVCLMGCDSWLLFGVGALCSGLGGGIYLDRMHRYYQWQ